MLGVCYYPEHWPESMWQQDASEMKALGLDYVRIGEFAWAKIEPKRDHFTFEWLDRAIDILADAGLKIVFGTPTATPPKWLIDEFPEILPASLDGQAPRGFGSRRHYDFSSEIYLNEALRITDVLTKRYGSHPSIVVWQTDNELCCHDTATSGSKAALKAFQRWCHDRYGTIEALNKAWGNVFWSMDYPSFEAIELPFGAVTETNPAHQLAFRRFSSDQVIRFHREMVKVIRENAPGKWVTHNFIPKEDLYVDAYAIGQELDISSYDNYPLGRTDLAFAGAPADQAARYMRTGHPDFATFYHDTSRSFGPGAYWVMEQQPGPVNWAPHNPRPETGMVRFWSLEAFAHGADCVSYFRWRQVPFAQEQMHAGLKRPDNEKAAAWQEVEQVRREIDLLSLHDTAKTKADVAIITDVEALWLSDIEQQGAGYDFTRVEFSYYAALRRLGVDVDFVSSRASFDGYKLVIVPCLPTIEADFIERVKASPAAFVFGPRSGAKSTEFSIPLNLAPGALQSAIGIKVISVETLRPDYPVQIDFDNTTYTAHSWCEELEINPDVEVLARYDDKGPAIVRQDAVTYIGATLEDNGLQHVLKGVCESTGVTTFSLPDDLRVRQRGDLTFAFNYAEVERELPTANDAEFLIGSTPLAPRDVAVWRTKDGN